MSSGTFLSDISDLGKDPELTHDNPVVPEPTAAFRSMVFFPGDLVQVAGLTTVADGAAGALLIGIHHDELAPGLRCRNFGSSLDAADRPRTSPFI